MGKASSSPPQQPESEPEKPDFGEPLDLSIVLALAKLDPSDAVEALLWFDEHSSERWKGALDR